MPILQATKRTIHDVLAFIFSFLLSVTRLVARVPIKFIVCGLTAAGFGSCVGWAKARLRRAHHFNLDTMVGTSPGAHSRGPLLCPPYAPPSLRGALATKQSSSVATLWIASLRSQ